MRTIQYYILAAVRSDVIQMQFEKWELFAMFGLFLALLLFLASCIWRLRSGTAQKLRRKGKLPRQYESTSQNNIQFAQLRDAALERSNSELELRVKQLEAEKDSLHRQLAEQEQLAMAGKHHNISEEGNRSPQAQLLYFLQPTSNGRFREAARVKHEVEGVYVLSLQKDNALEASVTFLNTPDNVILALQNEQTWVLVACERNNIPDTNTSSIKTDFPGKAVMKNGDWEIIQKARITYS